jgi:hypothetical protein
MQRDLVNARMRIPAGRSVSLHRLAQMRGYDSLDTTKLDIERSKQEV